MFKRLRVALFTPMLALLVGCSQSTQPSTTAPLGVYYATSQFSYTLNGQAFNRRQHLSETTGAAMIGREFGKNVISVRLRYSPFSFVDYHEIQFSFLAPVPVSLPATYVLADTSFAIAVLTIDTTNYFIERGQFTVTGFDTINSTVTGTFSFESHSEQDTSKHVTVTGGSFNDIGIYSGGFGQGSVTARANSQSFSAFGGDMVASFVVSGDNVLHILASTTDGDQQMLLVVPNPHVGSFNMNDPGAYALPSHYSSTAVQISTDQGAHGSIKLSMFDTATHRVSGTFNMYGPDVSGNGTVQITNGVIDSVHWFVL